MFHGVKVDGAERKECCEASYLCEGKALERQKTFRWNTLEGVPVKWGSQRSMRMRSLSSTWDNVL